MGEKVKKARFVTILEASRILGVNRNTVRLWIKTGRLKIGPNHLRKTDPRKGQVLRSSLKNAFKVKCMVCEKVFEAKHPEKARFCGPKHAMKAFWEKRRKYPRPGRPRKG
jgi:hypothetical protein